MISSKYSAFLGQPVPPSRSRINYLKQQQNACKVAVRKVAVRACVPPASLDKLLNTAKSELATNGLEVTSLEWKSRVLTLFVTRQGGAAITADDCADASNLIGDIIEQGNYLGDVPFTLQISSPGASQALTQHHEFEAFRGFPVCVNTTKDIKGKHQFWGTLAACSEGNIRIAVKGRVQTFKQEEVQEVRLCTVNDLQAGST